MIAALVLASTLAGKGGTVSPRPAPPIYVSGNYALTFRSPAHVAYCPLPDDWVGSDHGAVIFLKSPRQCGGSGFPSSARGFLPSDTPRIEVYYGYRFDEDERSPKVCHRSGFIRLDGQRRPLCQGREGRMTTFEADAPYEADQPAEVDLRLVTTPSREARDLAVLMRMAASVRGCAYPGSSPPMGSGAPCPKGAWF